MTRPPATYEVKPSRSGGGWIVQKKGATLPSAETSHKDRAVARARELALRTPTSRILIRGRDGSVEEELVIGSEARSDD